MPIIKLNLRRIKMNTEDKLKEAQELMDSATGSIRTLQRVIDRVNLEITTISKKIEAEKKPELRHGDYGYDKDGGFRIMISHDFKLYTAGDGCLHDANLGCYDLVVVLGNIFDDLKAMQEDVDEFEVKQTEFGDGVISVGTTKDKTNLIHIEASGIIYLTADQIADFRIKLGQIELGLRSKSK